MQYIWQKYQVNGFQLKVNHDFYWCKTNRVLFLEGNSVKTKIGLAIETKFNVKKTVISTVKFVHNNSNKERSHRN